MRHQGMVVLFQARRGWGFIQEGDEQYFFHISNAVPNFAPKPGTIVDFEIGPPFKLGQKDQATNIGYATDVRKEYVGGAQ